MRIITSLAGLILTLMAFSTETQQKSITLDDLIYIQTVKNSVKIDELLLQKSGWDCACDRQYDRIGVNKTWYKDFDESADLEKLDKITISMPFDCFSSYTQYYSADPNDILTILDEIKKRGYSEEPFKQYKNNTVDAVVTFYIGPTFAIQVVKGEFMDNADRNRYVLIIMDKDDYHKGLKIK